MKTETKNCRCQAAGCGCKGNPERCTCGDTCGCKDGCRCAVCQCPPAK